MQPTPARSPGLKPDTLAPTAATRPTISWPGSTGQAEPPHSPRTVWMSEWQMPQNRMSIWMSSAPGSRRWKENGASGAVAESAAKPWHPHMGARGLRRPGPPAGGEDYCGGAGSAMLAAGVGAGAAGSDAGCGRFIMAPVIGMKNTPTSRLE